jgi:hypothetical protein
MSTITMLRLRDPVQAWNAVQTAWKAINGWLFAGGGNLELEVRKETRSSKQNRLFHALIGDVSKQAEWLGKRRTPAEWKVLFVSGHSIATKHGAEMVPGLEGEFCNIRESTARMSIARMCSLCDYVMAWCAVNGVELRESKQWIDPETGEILEHE